MLKLTNVTKVFHTKKSEVTAADAVTFEVAKGEVFGLLGTNGAGKTTTLRMIATMLRPTMGNIEVCSFSTEREPDRVRRHIGLLFGGDTGLYDRLTARENIAYFGRLSGMTDGEIAARIDVLTRYFDMREYLDRRTAKFSRGMKQKTSFARAIIHDPEVLLLDEPSTGLDVVAAEEVNDFIRAVRAEGKTVLFSSHDMLEVSELCDRVAIMDKGRILDIGTIDYLTEKYGKPSIKEVFLHLVGGGTDFEQRMETV